MTVKLISFNRKSTVKRSPFGPLPKPAWLLDQLKKLNLLQDAYSVWHAWPTLESASYNLARLLGPEMKTHSGKYVTVDILRSAIIAFKSARADGETINGAAAAYVAELQKAGEMIVSNRLEANGLDPSGPVSIWNPTRGPYSDWIESLPDGYKVTAFHLPAFEGEFKSGRLMVAGLILTPSDFACLVYPSSSSTRGDM
jgi:hypothetical protein